MVTPFAGKVALITGAAGGIGLAVARAFADAGAALALVDRAADGMALDGLGDALPIGCDVGDPAALAAAVDATLERFGRWDMLVNVAGMMIFKPIEAHDAADWQQLMAVNLVAPALLTGHALRHMPRGGAIVNIASVHAIRTSPMVASYAASKAALVSLTRSTAIEGRDRGIRCNAILPGAIDTAMLRDSPNIRSGAEVIDPADIGRPEDIAALARFLASDDARFISGSEMVADAGRMARL
ncbi:SDR family NAD(P)-dependent oxidoreductase [Sphingomonas sp. R86521]|uniref:SDR family NAD(P)-dependent oxidoreductase n=1 Tax=Sphingomonas sp. R86521 TaxID=3093860 RepID=UPI0036D2C06B